MTAVAPPAHASAVRGVHYRTHGSGEVGVVVLHPAFADARVLDDPLHRLMMKAGR